MCTCGKCRFCKRIDGEWVCNNPESENYGLETEFDNECSDGEKRENRS